MLNYERQASHWEVDESDLVVAPAYEGRAWEIYSPSPARKEYLIRHRLEGTLFSSRARAVEVVRFCLASEPLPLNQPRTQWLSQASTTSEKIYLSKDGHWKLQVLLSFHLLIPHSEAAKRVYSAHDGNYFLLGATLRSCAFAADILNSVYSLTV